MLVTLFLKTQVSGTFWKCIGRNGFKTSWKKTSFLSSTNYCHIWSFFKMERTKTSYESLTYGGEMKKGQLYKITFFSWFWVPENPISGILEINSSLQVHVLYAFRILIGTIKNHMPEKVTVSINRISWFMYLIYGHFMFQLSPPANLSWILQHIPVPNV